MIEKIVDSILLDSSYCSDFNCGLKKHAEEETNALLKWISETFPDLEACDRASRRILDAMDAQQRWMLSNGIVIGLRLGAEIFSAKGI